MSTKPKFDIGLDAKYSIANSLTLDVTVNTDFAQVEADDQKINLTRYSLYFPEKRVFFLERLMSLTFLSLEETTFFTAAALDFMTVIRSEYTEG